MCNDITEVVLCIAGSQLADQQYANPQQDFLLTPPTQVWKQACIAILFNVYRLLS